MSQSTKIYVGNLPYTTTEDELRDFFTQYGAIEDIKLIIDFNTNRSKGFGFVTFASEKDCEIAIEKANGFDMGGRKLRVNLARENTTGGGAGGGRGGPGGRSNRGGHGGGGGRGGNRSHSDDRY